MAESNLAKLWKLAINGDKEAENEIFGYLSVRFVVIAGFKMCTEDAKEVSHDACLTVLKGYKNLGPPYEYTAWAQRVLRSKVINFLQRKALEKRVFNRSEIVEIEHMGGESNPDLDVTDALQQCLRKLGTSFPRYSRALLLKHHGYDTDSICSKMNIKRSNLYVLLNRGRSFMRDCLISKGIEA
jgi:RNA polymerase sigma factor (sigma-70 family)